MCHDNGFMFFQEVDVEVESKQVQIRVHEGIQGRKAQGGVAEFWEVHHIFQAQCTFRKPLGFLVSERLLI